MNYRGGGEFIHNFWDRVRFQLPQTAGSLQCGFTTFLGLVRVNVPRAWPLRCRVGVARGSQATTFRGASDMRLERV